MVSRRVLDPAPAEIFVLDTGLLIRIKQLVKVDEQWPLLAAMMRLVQEGLVCFPRQVAAELTDQRWPDAPGAWVGHAKRLVCHPEPDDESVSQVLAAASELVDADATGPEPADPYVVAVALQLQATYDTSRVVVASDDRVDRPPLRLSVKTACDRLGIEFCEPAVVIDLVRKQIAGPDLAQISAYRRRGS
jgi:hypothetical protein